MKLQKHRQQLIWNILVKGWWQLQREEGEVPKDSPIMGSETFDLLLQAGAQRSRSRPFPQF
jgi:hypothetical protein